MRFATISRWSPALARLGLSLAATVVLAWSLPPAQGATPAGTVVTNRASVVLKTGGAGGGWIAATSNTDTFAVVPPPVVLPAAGAFLTSATGIVGTPVFRGEYRDSAGQFRLLPPPPTLSTVAQPDGSVAVRFGADSDLRAGEFFLLRFVDRSADVNPGQRDAIVVTVKSAGGTDTETLRLTETGEDTGIFAALIVAEPVAPVPGDGRIAMPVSGVISGDYLTVDGHALHFETPVHVDPFGLLFDSATGEPLDGVSITLINADTEKPARVLGSDGVSTFPPTILTGRPVKDSGGATYELTTGRYVFPNVVPGHYRLAVKLDGRSGYTVPTALTDEALAAAPGAPYVIGVGSRAEIFTVENRVAHIDLPADPSPNTLVVSLSAGTSFAAAGDFVRYQLGVTNRRGLQAIEDIRVTIGLPRGFRLERKSTMLADQRIAVEPAPDGRSFVLRIPSLDGGATIDGSFILRLTTPPIGRATATALATSRALRSNEATATVLVRDELMSQRAQILGRVVLAEKGRPSRHGLAGVGVYLENGSMVVTDARGFFHFEGVTAAAHVVQVDTATLPTGAELLPARNRFDAGGDPGSRVVDVAAGAAWNVEFIVEVPPAAGKKAAPMEAPAAAQPGTGVYQKGWVEQEPVSQDWVLPAVDESPSLPVVRIMVKHVPAHKITAFINGHAVSPLNFNGTATNRARTLSVSMWSGVNLKEGDNTIEIVRKDAWGIERGREKRVVHFASPPARAEYVAKDSILAADGLTAPVIAVRLLDATGRPARKGVTGTFTVAEPYAARRTDSANLRAEWGASPTKPTYTVGEGGIARIMLEPTMTSGAVRLRFTLAEGPQEIRADLLSERKEWILLGIAEGSAGYSTINGHLANAQADDVPRGSSADGRIAFFVKGRIRGDWLLTAAFDSAKQRDPLYSRSLHGRINPETYYTVYGDQSARLEDAPTQGKLYVKLERKAATALIGDFSLDWTSMAFTSYARELHGAKVDYRGEKLRASVFQSDAGLSAMREEIRGDGTSGPFRLNHGGIVAFGERVSLQERDRDQPDIVIEETLLTHDVDYVMDHERGTLRLSRPLFSVSPALRPMFIVITYELEDAGAGKTQGGRVEVNAARNFSVGATAINETHDGKAATVAGLDARATVGKRLTARAEVARSDNEAGTSTAYRGDVAWRGKTSDVHVYAREIAPGFGLGQLNNAQVGNRQFGGEIAERLGKNFLIRAQGLQETALVTNETRQAGEVRAEYTTGPWTVRSGLRAVHDQRTGGEIQDALLATAGVTRRALGGRLEINVDREQSLNGQSENSDYPERTSIGATYALTPKVMLVGVQEWTRSTQRSTAATLLAVKSAPWTGGQVTGGVTQRYTDGGGTILSTGLEQRIRLNPHLELEGGFQNSLAVAGTKLPENASGGTLTSDSTPFHSASGFATAAQTSGDAAFVGVHWKPSAVQYDGRIEMANTNGSRRIGMIASAQAEPGKDLGLLGSVSAARQSGSGGGEGEGAATAIDLRFAVAWRPSASGRIVLNQIDLVHRGAGGAVGTMVTLGGSGGLGSLGGSSGMVTASGSGPQGLTQTGMTSLPEGVAWKVIDNFQLIQPFGDSWEASLHLGMKQLLTNIDDQHYGSLTSLGVLEVRRSLGPKWEIGVQGGLLAGLDVGTRKTSLGVFVTRRIGRDLAATVGFNVRGFRDDDFKAARYTSPGAYVRVRLRFDQKTIGSILRIVRAE